MSEYSDSTCPFQGDLCYPLSPVKDEHGKNTDKIINRD